MNTPKSPTSENSTQKKSNNHRCTSCLKKLSLLDQTVGKCKCGGVFCRNHTRPSKHLCSFDFHGENQAILAEKMVEIKAPKMNRI